jgi:hypothetical protein
MFFTSSSKMEASRPILLDPSQRANQLHGYMAAFALGRRKLRYGGLSGGLAWFCGM